MLSTTALLFLLLLSVWAKPESNADRFARGLPPLRPRKLYDASRALTAPLSKRSGVPPHDNFSCPGDTWLTCCPNANIEPSTVTVGDSQGTGCGAVQIGESVSYCSGPYQGFCCYTVTYKGDGNWSVDSCYNPDMNIMR